MSVSKKMILTAARTQYFLLSVVSPSYAAKRALRLFSTPNRYSLPETPLIKQSTKLTMLSNGWQLSGYSWGDSSKKVLILHGFESAAAKFEGYVTGLLEKGYQVIAFDAQAHGNSTGSTITLPEYIINIADVHKNYGPFNAYIGHSLGASAIIHFLESAPDVSAAKVVLIAPSTEASSLITRFCGILQLNNKVKNRLQNLIQQKTGQPVSYFSVIRALPAVLSQILWMHDTDDAITPFADAEKVESFGFQHVRFIPTSGLGHNKIYRDDSVKNEIMDFL